MHRVGGVSEGLAILVVDDDAAMRDMLVDQLRRARYDAAAAAGVDEAITLLRCRSFAAVLSDVRMEGKDGFQLLLAVESLDQPVPVVLMTSFGNEATARRARAEGAFAFLRKPFGSDELLDVLHRIPLP